jgi:hypothetical protein
VRSDVRDSADRGPMSLKELQADRARIMQKIYDSYDQDLSSSCRRGG